MVLQNYTNLNEINVLIDKNIGLNKFELILVVLQEILKEEEESFNSDHKDINDD